MEMYLDPPATARAFAETGMRAVQTSALNDFSQPLSMLEEWYLSLNGKDPYTSFVLGFHAEYTTSKDKVETIAALAEKYKAPVFTHLAETAAEVAQCRERYDMSPVAFLAKCGIFAYGGAGYHMVHTTEEDLGIIQKYDIGVVTNPGSNLKLASGIAPIHRYLNAGVRVAIGTDGPASNNGLDMLREMYLTATLGKVRENDASSFPPKSSCAWPARRAPA